VGEEIRITRYRATLMVCGSQHGMECYGSQFNVESM
jgi:hypothetical protein